MVDHQGLESEFGFVRHLENSLSIASRGARRLRALPKNCHLLPFAAILSPQYRYVRCNRFIRSLHREGMPASLGPGLRTVSGAGRSLIEKLSPSAVCPMTGGPVSGWGRGAKDEPMRAIGLHAVFPGAPPRFTSMAEECADLLRKVSRWPLGKGGSNRRKAV